MSVDTRVETTRFGHEGARDGVRGDVVSREGFLRWKHREETAREGKGLGQER